MVGLGRVGLACAVLALAAPSVASAAPVFRRFSLAQGLSESIVADIVQDRTGFLWFATEDGLNRFDGYRFTALGSSLTDPNTLSNLELRSLHEGRNGVLWIGTFGGGLNSLDITAGRVTRFRHDPANPTSIASDLVRCVREDRDGAVWVGTHDRGLDRLEPATGRFTHYRHDPNDPSSLPADVVRALYEDRGGTLWVGTDGGGLARLDRAAGRFTVFRRSADGRDTLPHDTVAAIMEDRSGTLWIGTYGGGLCSLDRASGRFTALRARPGDPSALPSDLVAALLEDHEGTLWVGTDGGGLARLDRPTRTFTTYRSDSTDLESLSADRIWSLLEDRSQVLWVGTYGGGLAAVDLAAKPFARYHREANDPDSLGHDIVWAICEDPDGTLWIGTDSGGLDRFDRRTGKARHFRHDPARPDSLAHDTVRVVTRTRDGSLWVGTSGGGLDRLDPSTGRFTHFRHDPRDPSSLAYDDLRAVYEDRSGTIWVATYGGGLDRFDPATGGFAHLRHDPADPGSIASDLVRTVFEDSRGTMWVGTQGGGVDRLDRRTGRFAHFRFDSRDPTSVGGDFVFCFVEAADGGLWVATYGGGISRLDRSTGKFTRYTVVDGLASNSTYGMLEDAQGFLWISTNRGLSRLDPRTGAFRNFDVTDGLQSNEFNGGSYCRGRSGELFFGGINGFNAFFPDRIGSNSLPPAVVITDLQIANRSVRVGERRRGATLLSRPIEYTDAVTLSYRDQVISLEFAALHFTAPEKNRYAYRLEGFSSDWIPASPARRFATFTGLAPGRYLFRVKAANNDGVWNEEGASLRLIVEPPLWATWWFRLAALLGLAAIAAGLYRRHMAHVRVVAELRTAHDAQMAILPQENPTVEGFEVSGTCVAANEVGGDFFDYFRLGGERGPFCIAVGDASGKAMRAAMNAVMTSGMVAAQADAATSLADVMTTINRVLHHKAPRHMFTALCLAALDERARTLTFVNAGLCPPLLKRGESVTELASAGPTLPLGPLGRTDYASTTAALAPGDVVVLFTDGVPEATDRAGAFYGYERVQENLRRLDTAGRSARAARDAIVDDVMRFAAGSRRGDDIAVVVVKVA